MRKPPSELELQNAVTNFNRRVKVGAEVDYFKTMPPQEGDKPIRTRTKTEASIYRGFDDPMAVVWLDSPVDGSVSILTVVPVEVPPTQYALKDGRRVFVRNGLGDKPTFKAFFLKPGKEIPHALPSPRLPWRDSEIEAQRDLDALIAEGKGIFKDAATVPVDCERHCPGRNLCCLCGRSE